MGHWTRQEQIALLVVAAIAVATLALVVFAVRVDRCVAEGEERETCAAEVLGLGGG